MSLLEALQNFHFAAPLWLVALPVPIVLLLLPRAQQADLDEARLVRYADPHLLPYLVKGQAGEGVARRRLGLWSLLWILGLLAMAGPRWHSEDVRGHRPGEGILVLFDISASMRATDVAPSRLARARQEVEDLLDRGAGFKFGLVAFASVPHVVAPMTEDLHTVRHVLPSLSPDLIQWQGSRVAAALERAERLLAGQAPGSRQTIVLVTDGDLAEDDLEARVTGLRAKGLTLHVLGVGTPDGAPVPGAGGRNLLGRDGRPVLSRLDEGRLEALAKAGGGLYRRADYRDGDTRDLLRAVAEDAGPVQTVEAAYRVWLEEYHLPLLAMAGVILLGMRRALPALVEGRASGGGPA